MDQAGKPIAGATVTLRRGDLKHVVLTDEAGEYCFCRLAPARDYVLEIEKEGFIGIMDKDTYVGRLRISMRNAILEPLAARPPGGVEMEKP